MARKELEKYNKTAIYECIDDGDFKHELLPHKNYISIQMNRVKLAGWVEIMEVTHSNMCQRREATEKYHMNNCFYVYTQWE